MLKEEIGFKHGIPENPDKKWEKEINGKTFTFVKERVGKNGVFVYNCARYRRWLRLSILDRLPQR